MPRPANPAAQPYAEFGELLRNLRIRAGLSQVELSELSGVNHSYLSRMERGDRKPSAPMLRKLAASLAYPYDQLAIAAGLLDREFSGQPVVSQTDDPLDDLRRRMETIQAGKRGSAQSASGGVRRRSIPLYDTVEAGILKEGNVVEGDADLPHIVLSEEELGWDPRAFALIVSGNSMVEAGILDGDVLVVSPNTRIRSGDIAVVAVEGQGNTVKKIYFDKGTILLQPCNSNFRPEVFDEGEVEVLGKVILVRRKLI